MQYNMHVAQHYCLTTLAHAPARIVATINFIPYSPIIIITIALKALWSLWVRVAYTWRQFLQATAALGARGAFFLRSFFVEVPQLSTIGSLIDLWVKI